MSISIIPFEMPYTQGVVDLILPIQQIEFNVPINLEMQPDLLEIPTFYQQNHGNFWIALDGEEVVGSIALIDIDNDEVCLRKMFVKAAYRGKEHQIAQRLLDIVLKWCRARCVKGIYLGTREDLYAARRFYEKNGFFLTEKENLPKNFPIMSVDSHFYGYVLEYSIFG
jgi:N-acetylglutamate synthase-like GNAT family acetyltransferase